jgi:hypothetical protein
MHLQGGQDHFVDNVAMLTFSSTILLMCVRARNKVRDANITEKGIKLSYSPPQSLCMARIFRLNIRSTRV